MMTTLATSAPFTLIPQPFEAGFLGGPVLRLNISDQNVGAALTSRLPILLNQYARDGVRLIACRVPLAWQDVGALLGRHGFREIERLITFERRILPTDSKPLPVAVRLATPEDTEDCVEIGRTAFHADRFHADPLIPSFAADDLKAQWMRNGLGGRADAALVVREAKRAVGFSLLLKQGEVAVIDLIAVAAEHRGKGHASALVAAGLSHYAGSATHMRVGTQASNERSIALYRRFGFEPVAEAITWHWHPA